MTFATEIPTNPFIAVLVAGVLFGLGRLIIKRVAFAENNQWLVRIMTIGLVLHLIAAPTQIFVVEHVYGGIADWTRYTHQGAILAPNFHRFDFTLAGANLRQIVNDGSVSIATGIVMAIVGVNLTATFLVFSWLSWVGCVLFYRAFTLTFAGADHRRYALMLFFLPSLIFWTADVSKESIMMLSLGLVAYGGAKIFARQRGGFILLVPGVTLGYYVRHNELLLVLSGFAVAMMLPTAGARQNLGGLRRFFSLVVLSGLLFISVYVTLHYLRGGGGTLSLNQTHQNNQGVGTGFGSSGIPYSTDPITWPRDAYEVLFNPLIFKAHGNAQRVAGIENTIIIVLILRSLRNLRILPRAAFARPYLMLCAVYSVIFIYTFAALGNLGLIERERVMLLPFLLVLLCTPRAPKGSPPRYLWELRRKARLQIRRANEEARRRQRPGAPVPLRR
ncbi:MAG: hypothetical protein ABSF33_13815 [Acidimicrobiales bacterium]